MKHSRHTRMTPELLFVTVKRLVWFGHVTRTTLYRELLHSQRERGRRQAGQKKNWLTHVKEWSSKKGGPIDPTVVTKFRAGPLYHRDRSEWRALSSVTSLLSPNDLYQSRKKSINEISH